MPVLAAGPLLLVAVLAISAVMSPSVAAGQQPLKVYVSADMEGVAGLVHRDQVDPEGGEFALGRRLMTAEINAIVAGAFAAGADEVLVSDSHWNKRNLLWEDLDPRARVISGGYRALGMMEGIDSTFGAVIFQGYHASEGHPKGVLGHTWSNDMVDDVRLNGGTASEGVLNAAIAGHFGVPVILTTGDRWANEEVRAFVGDVETADVKEGLNQFSANSLVPARALELIREKTESALRNRGRYQPKRLAGPIVIEVRFKEVVYADAAVRGRPGIERVDAKTVRYTGPDMVDVFQAFAGMF
ncbi:MAG: M55 family metallopeptidase [Gemmatimonadota bacterium]